MNIFNYHCVGPKRINAFFMELFIERRLDEAEFVYMYVVEKQLLFKLGSLGGMVHVGLCNKITSLAS